VLIFVVTTHISWR